jgi:hypothetical protein
MGNQINKFESNNTNSGDFDNFGTKTNSSNGNKFFAKDYSEVKMENTPTLGEYKVYERLNEGYEELVLAKEATVDNAEEFKKLMAVLDKRKLIKTSFLADFVTYFKKVETEWCSKYYRVWMVYEYAPLTLEKELWDRFKMSQSSSSSKVNILKIFIFDFGLVL